MKPFIRRRRHYINSLGFDALDAPHHEAAHATAALACGLRVDVCRARNEEGIVLSRRPDGMSEADHTFAAAVGQYAALAFAVQFTLPDERAPVIRNLGDFDLDLERARILTSYLDDEAGIYGTGGTAHSLAGQIVRTELRCVLAIARELGVKHALNPVELDALWAKHRTCHKVNLRRRAYTRMSVDGREIAYLPTLTYQDQQRIASQVLR